MTIINKEKLMIEIIDTLKQKTKDYPKHIDNDLVHLDMGELSSYEAIFNIVYSKGAITDGVMAINRLFKKELEDAHKITT